jgi:hypothetical protein
MRSRTKKSHRRKNPLKKKSHKRRYDGHYHENDVRDLFSAILNDDLGLVEEILDSDITLIRTSYIVPFNNYTEIELLPKSYAQLLDREDIVRLIDRYRYE